jgi:RNA polymerase subunit RPABC4/transcription elongation factor Spt4
MSSFLDRVRQEIDRGVVTIGAKSKALLETTQLRSQIRLLQKQKEDGIKELGQLTYSMLGQGAVDNDRLAPYATALQALDAKISDLEEQVRRAEAAAASAARSPSVAAFAHCDRCGAPLAETSRFCRSCGGDVTAVVEQAKARRQDATRACPSCGTTVGADVRFCPVCGQAQGEPVSSASGSTGGG